MAKLSAVLALFLGLLPAAAFAHGDVGERSFPATLSLEDPGVGDEVTLPQIATFKEYEDGDYSRTTEFEGEVEKRLTDDFGLSLGGELIHTHGEDGLSNLEVGAKYQFLENAPHEFLMSAGVEADIGGSGTEHSGASDYTTVTPTLFFGKGMGDVSATYLKPIAVTGQLGYSLPTDRNTDGERNPDTLNYGVTLQYQMNYLENLGLTSGSSFLDQLTPIVELSMQTPFRGDEKFTTGTVQPGVLWQNENGVQVGLEAILPVTSHTGRGVGAVAQLHFYLDDLMPNSPLAKPVW